MRRKKLAALILSSVLIAGIGLTGCGSKLNADAVVATVNGKEINAGLANFVAQYTAVTYDTFYMQYFGADMWTQENGGTTMTDSVKENTLEQLEEYYLLEEHMGDYGVELTDEDTAAIEKAAAQFMEDNTAEGLKAMGATEEYVKEMLRLNTLQSKMRDAIVADVDRNVPDEECAQKSISYVRVSKSAGASEDAEDEEEKDEKQAAKEAEEKAQKILDAAMLGSQEDPLEAAAKANDASVLTCSYGKADLEKSEEGTPPIDLEAIQAADKLDEKEISKKLIETDGYYYIVRMDSLFDEEATENERKSIISVRENDRYTQVVDGYKESADWSIDEKVWEPVNFETLYTKVQNNPADDAGAGAASGSAVDEDEAGVSGENGAGASDENGADENEAGASDENGAGENEAGASDENGAGENEAGTSGENAADGNTTGEAGQ